MDLVVTGVVAGVLGTLVMDSLNHLLARTGMLIKIDMRMIGRMSVGWSHGRFCYRNPSEMEQVANEKLYGYITHYTIGVGLAIPFVLGWDLLVGGLFTLPWGWEYLAGGLPKALGLHFPVWQTTSSSGWVWLSRLLLREHREGQNA